MRFDTLRKNLVNEMASIVIHGRHGSDRFVQIAPDINLTWEDKIYPGGVWSVDVGTLDVLKDNPEAQAWFEKTFKGKKPSSLRVAKMYVEHLMDDVLPEGANYHFKGQAIQGQNKPGTPFGEGATGAAKNDVYQKWWSEKKGMRVLPDGSMLYQSLGEDVTRPPITGAPNEYIEALSKEDWRKRKRLSPNERIKNTYGAEWGVPKEKWWKVETAGEGIEGRLKTKNNAYDNFKTGIRRAGIKGKTLTMSPWEWDAVYESYKYAQKHGYHVDHIDPISKSGFHVWDNLQVLDANDNLVKSAKTDVEGIIPKKATYLTEGPLTKKDWIKYTRKNKALQAFNQIDTKALTKGRTLRSIGRGFSQAEVATRFAAGDYIGGSIGAAMQTPVFQKAIAKTLAKSGAKIAPGVGIGLSTLEAAGYSSEGRWTQAGIAALSGVVGEVPVVGDLISAGLDLTNTGIDIATGNIKPDIDEESLLRQTGRIRL